MSLLHKNGIEKDTFYNNKIKKILKNDDKFKGLILISLLLVAIILMLFMPSYSYTDSSVDLSLNISGFKVISSLFTGGKLTINNIYFGPMSLVLPISVSIFFIVGILLIVFSIVILFITSFIEKKVKYQKTISGTILVFTLLYFVFIYLILVLTSWVKADNLNGETAVFYRYYVVGPSWLLSIFLLLLTSSVTIFLKREKIKLVRKYIVMYLLLIIPTLFMLIFNIYPVILQLVLSFKEYSVEKGIWGSTWIGFSNFKTIFMDKDIHSIVLNTLIISCLRIVIQIIPPILLAIFLFDMGKDKYRSKMQTVLYLPHFFSWVVIYGIAYAFINPEGLINSVLLGIGKDSVKILTSETKFIPLLLITDLWKELGWGTIIFLAALTGIDPSTYEAAAIDGAGAWKKFKYVTLPGMKPTIAFVSIMAVGNVLKGAGYEQILLFGSETMKSAQVIDTWVYWKGLNGLQYGISSAVSFLQSAVGLILVLGANKFSKKKVGISLF